MSMEEDTELRDIVLDTLDQRGVVGKAKAMLRANIFTALEETVAPQDKMYLLNKRLKENLSSSEGKLMAGLIVDYLTCLDLEFSKTVFEPETGFDCQSVSRSDLSSTLGISPPADKRTPLLSEVIKRSKSGGGDQSPRRQHNHNDLTAKQIAEAQSKFSQYDKDGNGTIDKDELRQLFIDMFPNFHRNMLERYVTDEFRATDTDFSAGIDFDEFLDLYRRLFISCRSVVSHDMSDIIGPISTPRSPSPRLSKIPIKNDHSPTTSKKDNPPSPRIAQGSKIPQLSSSPGAVPSGNNSPTSKSPTSKSPTSKSSSDFLKAPGGGGSGEPSTGGFLSDLPSLDRHTDRQSISSSTSKSSTSKAGKTDIEIKKMDKNLADLGFDIPDDDEESVQTKSGGYEDDFERSNASSYKSSRKSLSESIKTADSLSTDDTTDKIIDDDDIDALLKDSDISWGNDTEDKSIADDSSLKGVDYWEVVPKK